MPPASGFQRMPRRPFGLVGQKASRIHACANSDGGDCFPIALESCERRHLPPTPPAGANSPPRISFCATLSATCARSVRLPMLLASAGIQSVLGKYSERRESRKMTFMPRCCFCGAVLWSPFEVGSYQGRTGLHLAHRDCRDEFLTARRGNQPTPNVIYSKPSATEIGVVGSPDSSRPGSALPRRGSR